MRTLAIALVLLAAPLHALASEVPRLSGSGGLVAGDATSADGRLSMRADLKPSDRTQQGGRFNLTARLAMSDSVKAVSTACTAGPDVFRNGFE